VLHSFDEIEALYVNVKIPCPFCSGLNENCPECKGSSKISETRLITFEEFLKRVKENW